MNTNKLSPFDYISEQVKVFVVNRLAQSPATTQQLADTFALLVDDLTVSEKSLNYVLDALYKQKIVSFEYTHGVRCYYLRKFLGDNIFELNLEEAERLIVEDDVPFYEKKEPTLEDDFYFETIDGKICIQINRPLEVEEVIEDEPTQEPTNNDIEIFDNEVTTTEDATQNQGSEEQLPEENDTKFEHEIAAEQVFQNAEEEQELQEEVFVEEEFSRAQKAEDVQDSIENPPADDETYSFVSKDIFDENIQNIEGNNVLMSENDSSVEESNVEVKLENSTEEQAFEEDSTDLSDLDNSSQVDNDDAQNEIIDNQLFAQDYSDNSPAQDENLYDNNPDENYYLDKENVVVNNEYSFDSDNTSTYEENINSNENIIGGNEDLEENIKEPHFEENIVTEEEKKCETETQESPIFIDEYNQSENNSVDTEEVDQSSYFAFGNTSESDELLMKVFGSHFFETSKKQEETPLEKSTDQPVEELVKEATQPVKEAAEESVKAQALENEVTSKEYNNEVIEQEETPVDNSTSSDIDNTQSSKRINADDIVFTSTYVYEAPQISTEEEQQRIENALKKLNEYSQKPEPKKEIIVEEQPETEENIEPELPTISREEEQQRIENALKKLSEYSQKSAPKVDTTPEEKVEPQVAETDPEPEPTEEPIPQKNTLSVASYIEEQEVINSYDWERKLTRCFVDCHIEEEDESNNAQDNVIVSTYAELKDIMEKKNYKFKPYSNYDSVSFYSDNYIFSNRLARDTSIYTYLFLLIEIFIGYFFVDKFIHKGIAPYIILAVCLLVIPIVFVLKYFAFKDKRKPANFYFSISIVTAMMIYVNLMVMVVLLAFFIPSLNVSVTNLSSMITTVFYPAGLFLAIPFSVCVYSLLYHSKKYHLH